MTDLPASLPEYERRAGEILPPDLAAYFLRGAGEERTLRRNRDDLGAIELRPRVLRDLRGGGTSLTLLGHQLTHPILVAPMAFQTLLHPDGEIATAAAATAQEACMVLSTQASKPMETVRAAGYACRWFQLYWQANRAATMALVDRAGHAGFQALVLTLDAPVNGVRDAELASGFTLPGDVRAVNLDGLPQAGFDRLGPRESAVFDRIAHVLPTWDDLAWLCEISPLPVVVKGVLHPDDATQAVAAGAKAVIVSNHGGRVLDGGPSSIAALPCIAEAIAGTVPVLMDGGIRRGVDVLRAIALGADAVLVGRPVVHGLAVAGAQGVSHVLRLLRDELEVAMALTGCRTLADITRGTVGR